MRYTKKVLSLLTTAALVAMAMPQTALAATGVIYITPSSSSLQVGSSETVSLRINPGTTVDGVQATVSYNPGYLQLNSVDTSASPFNVQLQKSYGGGTITLSLGNLSGGVSSDSLIAAMNFTALAGSGSSALTLSGANATSSGSYTNPAAAGANISFTSPSSPAPNGGSGGGSVGGSSNYTSHAVTSSNGTSTTALPATPTAAATQSTTTPVHLQAKLGKLTYTSAIVKVTSNQNLSFSILYGSDPHQLNQKVSAPSAAASADLMLGQAQALEPGTVYYYQVVGQAADGSQTTLPVQQLTTLGYTVRVTVLDQQNHLLSGSKVTLHSRAQTATTNGNGVATFMNVSPGLHHVTYQLAGKSYSAAVYVEDNVPSQTAAVVLPVQLPASNLTALAVALLITGLALALMGWEIFRHEPQAKEAALKLAMAARSWIL